MKKKSLNLDSSPVIDLNRTTIDVSSYIDQYPVHNPRIYKKRNSVIILNLKQQLKKDSRFVSLLCNKSSRSRRNTEKNSNPFENILLIPPGISQIDINSEPSCPTPMKNDVLRHLFTPVSINKVVTPSLGGRYTPGQISSKQRKLSPVRKTKLKRKRIFKTSERFEAYKLSLSPKLKKRSLNTEGGNIRMFDRQEILNITNGEFSYFHN
jgi:hypothetical protein